MSSVKKLKNEITKLKPVIGPIVKKRLKQFEALHKKGCKDWFSELCFCILTSNSKASTAMAIQKELGPSGFKDATFSELVKVIIKNKHRFHNNKARFIVEARQHSRIKRLLNGKSQIEAREWLVNNIKGIGWKEASHFLRNTNHLDVAILDRHVLKIMLEHGMITEIPKALNSNNYLLIEKKLASLSKSLKMSQGELDFYLWYLKANDVLK